MNTVNLQRKASKYWAFRLSARGKRNLFILSAFILSYLFSSVFLPASYAAEPTVPAPGLDLTFPVYLGSISANGERAAVLYFRLDKRGVAEAEFVPVRKNENGFSPLPPEERAAGLAEITAKFPGLADSDWRSEATFWNGQTWQSAPALAYIRDAALDGKINLPTERTLQVRDLSGESGGFSTGRAVTDFSKETQTDERIELSNGKLKIWRPQPDGQWQVVWESKPSWQVMQFTFGDADEDGRPEIMFTLWKNDGQDDKGQDRSHPFVYGWRRDEIRPVWAGSALVDPIREFALGNFTQSESGPQNQLIVLEGSYKDERAAPARAVTVWQWNGWGYELLWRGAPGCYSALRYVSGQPFAFYKRLAVSC
jgi:ketosteroid isomerase-like protein